jgi:hypothetical protein
LTLIDPFTWRHPVARQADDQKFIEWRARLARHAKSGLTVARFCDREDVTVATFHYWRRKCGGEAAEPELTRAEFAPVEVVHGSGVTIRFPGGAVMEIPETREDLLRALVAALAGGSEPC